MRINVPQLGEMEVPAEKILQFTQGLFAFEEYKKYFILDPEEKDFPFRLLKSLEEESLGFIITDPFLFKPDYEFELDEETLQELEIEKPEDILTYVLLVIPDKVEEISANLAAPVIVNMAKQLAKQVILQCGDYPTKYMIFQNQKEVAHVNP